MVDYVGDVLEYDIYVVGTAHQPLVGESPILTDGHGPTEAHGFHISELGGGYYRITSNPADEAGAYGVVAQFRTDPDTDPDFQRLSVTWDVDPIPAGQDLTILLEQAQGTSLGELRRRVARAIRDYRKGVATSAGSKSTFSDIFNLVNNTDFFRGAEIICTAGHPDNIGKKRKVVSSNFEGGTITFVPELPQPTQVGDQFDIFHFIRNGFGVQEYDDAINDAINAGFPGNRVAVAVRPLDAFNSTQGYIDIPSTLYALYDVTYEVPGRTWQDWESLTRSNQGGQVGWGVDIPQRRLYFGAFGGLINDRSLVLYGYAHPAPLVNDDDLTMTDPEWLVEQALGVLLQSSMDQSTFAFGQARQNRADQLRSKMVTPAQPSTIYLE